MDAGTHMPFLAPLTLLLWSKEVMIGYDPFDWSLTERLLHGVANRKHHVVVTPYIPWPGQELQQSG